MTGATVLTRFTADTKDFDSKTKSVNASISSIAKGVLVATGVTKALGAAFNLVSRNMDTAIDRFDTLNNFPKVMSNLGISAEDSQKSIDKLSKKLVGLPTTLQDGALAVQRLTSKNGDIKKSTDLFLAMNNAILAGGASSEIQANAIEQLSQAYAKGKPDMMEWRSLMTAMPAQLKQVAQAMGYVDADALGEALRDGSVSMDEFMNTIDRLNKEGLPGFQSFEEQARNSTGGIRTAITNMNSRVAQGIEALIRGVNEGLQKANIGTLANVFENVGNVIRDTLKSLVPYITKAIIFLSQLASWIIKNKDWLEMIIVPLIVFITTFAAITKLIAIVKGISAAVGVLNAVLLANPIVLIIAAVVALIAIFVLLWNKCEWFRNFWIGLWDGIKQAAVVVVEWFKTLPENISNIINSIIGFLSNLPYYIGYMIGFIIGKLYLFLTQDIPSFVNGVINWFTKLPSNLWNIFTNIISKVGQWFSSMWNKAKTEVPKLINNIINWFKQLPGKMIEIGGNIISGIWKGIKNAKDWLWGKIKDFAKGIVKGFKDALGIHSPSKEFALIGKFSVLGYTEQLDKMTKQVQSQIASTFQVSPQLAASSSMHYSPSVNVQNNISMTQDPLGQMVNSIKTFSGGAKNDYNYGAGF